MCLPGVYNFEFYSGSLTAAYVAPSFPMLINRQRVADKESPVLTLASKARANQRRDASCGWNKTNERRDGEKISDPLSNGHSDFFSIPIFCCCLPRYSCPVLSLTFLYQYTSTATHVGPNLLVAWSITADDFRLKCQVFLCVFFSLSLKS